MRIFCTFDIQNQFQRYEAVVLRPFTQKRMKLNQILRYTAILAIILANIGCDQISKSVVRENVGYNERIQLVNDNVILTKVENSGAFLSLGDSLNPTMKNLLLLALPVLAILFGLWWLFSQSRNVNKGALVAWCSIMGGGIGNIFDRAVHSSVTDFLYIHWGIFKTGIFNFADVSITAGIIFIIAQQLFANQKI